MIKGIIRLSVALAIVAALGVAFHQRSASSQAPSAAYAWQIAPSYYLAQAQNSEPNKASLVIRSHQPKGVINRNIQGQFAEHLGRLIYEGLWAGEDLPIPNTRGLRNDVTEKTRIVVTTFPLIKES